MIDRACCFLRSTWYTDWLTFLFLKQTGPFFVWITVLKRLQKDLLTENLFEHVVRMDFTEVIDVQSVEIEDFTQQNTAVGRRDSQ